MKQFSKTLLETSFGRVYQHTQNRNIGLISASRGHLSPEENNKRHEALKSDIRKAGFGFVPVKGRYVENFGTEHAKNVDEKSLLVIGKEGHDNGHLLGFLKNHGEKYEQDSVLHKSHNSKNAMLHGTNESGWPGKGQTHDVGSWHPNRAGEFHSLIKGKKQFNFSEESFYFVKEKRFFNREENLF